MNIYQPKRILIPADFSDYTPGVLRAAAEIARRWGAEMHVLHIAKESDHVPHAMGVYDGPRGGYAMGIADRSKLLEDARLHLQSRLEQLLQQAGAAGPKAHAEVMWGEPEEEILRTAEHGGHDLIIMATHGRRGLSRMFLGSVTEDVIRRAPCPVLVMRDKVAQEAGEAVLAGDGRAAK